MSCDAVRYDDMAYVRAAFAARAWRVQAGDRMQLHSVLSCALLLAGSHILGRIQFLAKMPESRARAYTAS